MNNYNLKNQGYNYVSKKIYFAVGFNLCFRHLSNWVRYKCELVANTMVIFNFKILGSTK